MSAEERGTARCASWLADELLVVAARVPARPEAIRGAWLESGDSRVRADSSCLGCATGITLLALRLPGQSVGSSPLGRLALEAGERIPLAPEELSEVVTDMRTLLREELAGLDARDRRTVLDFLVDSAAAGGRSDLAVSRRLHLAREMLRERLPAAVASATEAAAVSVESLLAIDERSFYVRGWARAEGVANATLTAISPEGEVVELEPCFRFGRPDVAQFFGLAAEAQHEAKLGFAAFFRTRLPSVLAEGWKLEQRDGSGGELEADMPKVVGDEEIVRNVLLRNLSLEPAFQEELKATHLRPALTRLQERRIEAAGIDEVRQHGTPPASPHLSVVVPLFKRVDFLQQQLAQFVHDPELKEVDLVYVLDSPELANQTRDLAAELFRLYRLPFRLAILQKNGGFAAANNAGVQLASGRLVILLNSDILPSAPGWAGRLRAFYDASPRVGALAPKLLYENDAIQHAGLYFHRPPGLATWGNEYFFKGLDRDFPAANVSRQVPAVTAACMMIDRELYAAVGGLRGLYVQGDYEDSDLCLRLLDLGYENWYFAPVELYHLEAQSYPAPLRELATAYNRWLHTRLWHDRIAEVMARLEPGRLPTQGVEVTHEVAGPSASGAGQTPDSPAVEVLEASTIPIARS